MTRLLATASIEPWIAVVAAVGGFAVALVGVPLGELFSRWRVVRRRTSSVARRDLVADTASPLEWSAPKRVHEALGNLAREPIRGPRIYALQISASNFRCFEHLTVALNHPGVTSDLTYPNVNLIIGDNGAGKSTLLKALAIGALGPILDSSGFVPYHLVRARHREAWIHGDFIVDSPDGAPSELTGRVDISRTGDYEKLAAMHDLDAWSGIFDESNPSFLVVGYGVNRRIATDESERSSVERGRRRRRYERIATLFDESAVLTPLSSWLPRVRPRRRVEVEELLAALLPADTHLADGTVTEALFTCRGQEVPYRALSDGYKSFIGWVGDLLSKSTAFQTASCLSTRSAASCSSTRSISCCIPRGSASLFPGSPALSRSSSSSSPPTVRSWPGLWSPATSCWRASRSRGLRQFAASRRTSMA